jgi:heme/copper-type cytochrome/quinol oxidase subunit 1
VHDVAFPRLNSAAFWFLPGGLGPTLPTDELL